MLRRIINRLRAAVRTNTPQASAMWLLTAMNLLACSMREGESPWWLWLVCFLFWPISVFIHNLFNPMSGEDNQ